LHFIFVPYVGAYTLGFDTSRTEFPGKSSTGVIATTRDYDPGAFVSECQCGRAPYAGQRAGDENNGAWHVYTLVKGGATVNACSLSATCL
jgi:hypothetical protein